MKKKVSRIKELYNCIPLWTYTQIAEDICSLMSPSFKFETQFTYTRKVVRQYLCDTSTGGQ